MSDETQSRWYLVWSPEMRAFAGGASGDSEYVSAITPEDAVRIWMRRQDSDWALPDGDTLVVCVSPVGDVAPEAVKTLWVRVRHEVYYEVSSYQGDPQGEDLQGEPEGEGTANPENESISECDCCGGRGFLVVDTIGGIFVRMCCGPTWESSKEVLRALRESPVLGSS